VTLRAGDGAWPAPVLYVRDITHETEVSRLKSEFLTTAAHELRTPLASIHGFSELLLRRPYDEATRREMLQTIHGQSTVLSHLVQELLDLARIEARAGLDFKLRLQPLRPLLESVLKDFRVAGDEREPTCELMDRLPLVDVDETKFRQALANVLGNAYKYSPDGGAIEVRTRLHGTADGEEVGIEVTDHGIGMSAEDSAQAFERFFRADLSGHIPGAGLGLALVQQIMQHHRGRAELHSALGVGTTVTLWLPAKGWPEAGAAAAATHEAGAGPG
jgi:signal transduction histidine kinase